MGLVYSYIYRKRFVINHTVEGQDESALEVFETLGLSRNDVDLLYTAFWDIDADGSGLIRPSELFSYFEVEGTKFECCIFSLFDEDNSGMINFMEFVCTLWNLLTLPEPDFGSIAYLIKDPSATGTINYTDVRELLEMMHSKKIDKDPSIANVYAKMRKELGHTLTITDFTKWTAANPFVVAPVMMLQLHIRLQIIGEPFWAKLALQRKEHPEQGKLDYVKHLQTDIVSRNDVFRQRKLAEEIERRRLSRLGKGRMGDGRDNITRKQSLLLDYFNLKKRSQTVHTGKSLSRVFVINDDLVEGSSGKPSAPRATHIQTPQSSSSKKSAAIKGAKKDTTTATSSANASDSEENILNTEVHVGARNSKKPEASSNKKKVVTVTASITVDGNRRRRSSLTMQKPDLVREKVAQKAAKESKYKLQKKRAGEEGRGNATAEGASGKKSKSHQSSSKGPKASTDNNSDINQLDEDEESAEEVYCTNG